VLAVGMYWRPYTVLQDLGPDSETRKLLDHPKAKAKERRGLHKNE
jgi:hypothetical protein